MTLLPVALAAGFAGGLVASWIMERFQELAAPAFGHGDSKAKPATVQLADIGSRAVTGRPVAEPRQMLAGGLVHYLTGAALGIFYGGMVWVSPVAALGFGALYGIAVGLVLDDTIVPALGLGDWPWRTALRTHVYGMTSHLVFGLALEAVRRLIVTVLG